MTMTPKEYIEETEKCIELAKKNGDRHSFDTYYGMLCGAREIIRLVKNGYSIDNITL
jgi:hypothetical protein